MQTDVVRIGTRGSQLALAQAAETRARLRAAHDMPEEAFEIVVIRTSGDRSQDRPLSEAGGKGLFTKEIEEALFDGRIDLAVHSSKDMPTVLPDGLEISAFLEREDALLVSAGVEPRLTDPVHCVDAQVTRRVVVEESAVAGGGFGVAAQHPFGFRGKVHRVVGLTAIRVCRDEATELRAREIVLPRLEHGVGEAVVGRLVPACDLRERQRHRSDRGECKPAECDTGRCEKHCGRSVGWSWRSL